MRTALFLVFLLAHSGIHAQVVKTASYKECDIIVHDKLEGAEARSPSDCEAEYDLDISKYLDSIITPMIDSLTRNGWDIQSRTGLDALTAVVRGSEKDIFNSVYEVRLQANASSPAFIEFQKQLPVFSSQLDGSKGSIDRFKQFTREMNGKMNISISISVNSYSIGITNFNGGAQYRKTGNIITVESPGTQSPTGGGEDDSRFTMLQLFGNWKQPSIVTSSDGSQEIQCNALVNKTMPHLAPHNIVIRVDSDNGNARQIMRTIRSINPASLLKQ